MQRITYLEAAGLLGRSYESIKQAVSNGGLTRCSTPIRPAYLIKEQVMLFKEHARITPRALSKADRQQWEEYKQAATGKTETNTEAIVDALNRLISTSEQKNNAEKSVWQALAEALTNTRLEGRYL